MNGEDDAAADDDGDATGFSGASTSNTTDDPRHPSAQRRRRASTNATTNSSGAPSYPGRCRFGTLLTEGGEVQVRVVESPTARAGDRPVATFGGYVDAVHERWCVIRETGTRHTGSLESGVHFRGRFGCVRGVKREEMMIQVIKSGLRAPESRSDTTKPYRTNGTPRQLPMSLGSFIFSHQPSMVFDDNDRTNGVALKPNQCENIIPLSCANAALPLLV